MNQETPNIRERLLAIFEVVRETPGAAFEAEHLVQYLIDNPERRIELHNTFKGKRRFFRFMRTIEEEYTICFSLKDNDLTSLEQWVDRVNYLCFTPKSSLTTIATPATSGQHSVAHSEQRRRLGGTCAAAAGNNAWTGAQMLGSNPHLMPDASLTRSLHRSRLPRRRLDLAPSVVDTPAQRSDPPAPA